MPKRPEEQFEVESWESWLEPGNRQERRALESLMPRARSFTVTAHAAEATGPREKIRDQAEAERGLACA